MRSTGPSKPSTHLQTFGRQKVMKSTLREYATVSWLNSPTTRDWKSTTSNTFHTNRALSTGSHEYLRWFTREVKHVYCAAFYTSTLFLHRPKVYPPCRGERSD